MPTQKTIILYLRTYAVFFTILAILFSTPGFADAAVISLRAVGTVAKANNAVLAMTHPTTRPGDVMILQVVNSDTFSYAVPTGWTRYVNHSNSGAMGSVLAWAVATTTAANTLTLPNSGSNNTTLGVIISFKDVDVENPVNASSSNPTAAAGTSNDQCGTSGTMPLDSVTPTVGSTTILAHGFCDNDGGTGTFDTVSSKGDPDLVFTELADDESISGNDSSLAFIMSTNYASTTAIGNRTVNTTAQANAVGIGALTALKPRDITIHGNVYSDEGVTALSNCDGVTKNIRFVVATGTPGTFDTFCRAADGFFTATTTNTNWIATGTPIVAFINGVANVFGSRSGQYWMGHGSTTAFDIYQNHVIIDNNLSASSTNIGTLAAYDGDNDSDIQYKANGSNLFVNAGSMLYIAPGSEFKPAGSVTVFGNGANDGIDGSLRLGYGNGWDGSGTISTGGALVATSSILSMGANTLTLAGSFYASSSPNIGSKTILNSTGTTTFNATSTVAKNIIATTTPFYNLEFGTSTPSGPAGSWTFGGNQASTTNNFAVIQGTTTLPSTLLDITGNFANTGRIISTAGTTTFNGASQQYLSGAMVGTSTFTHLVFSGAGAKNFASSTASTTNLSILSGSGAVTAPSGTLSVSGNFSNSSTFTHNSGTVVMIGTSNTLTGDPTTFNNLTIDPATAGTITPSSSDATITGTLNVASGDTFSLNSGIYATSTGTITLNGTISGAGTLVVTDTSGGPGTTGTLSSTVRYDATLADVPATTLDARTGSGGTGYGGLVEIYSGSSAAARTATLASGTYDFNVGLNLLSANSQNVTLDGTANNPTVTEGATSGDLDFTGTGAGSEIIKMGTGAWTVSGNADFTGGNATSSTGGTFIMSGASKTLTSASSELQNVTLSGTITTADNLSATGTMILSGNSILLGGDASTTGNATITGNVFGSTGPNANQRGLILNGSAKTLTGGGNLGSLLTNGSYTLSTTDLSVASTTVATSSTFIIPTARTLTSTSTLIVGGTLTGAGTTTVQHSNLGGGGTFATNFAMGTSTATISLPSRAYALNFEALSGTTVTASSATTTVGGNFIQNGTFTANSGSVYLASSTQQTLSGTMSGSSAFYRLVLENISGSDATTSPSVIFRNVASTTNTFSAGTSTGSVKMRFGASATSTFQNVYLNGYAAGTRTMLRSSTAGTKFGFAVPGTRESVQYVDFMDTNACDGSGDISAGTGNNADSGNNGCVTFTSAVSPTISSAANQTFAISTTNTNSQITVTSGTGASNFLDDVNDLRIAIATSTADLWWDTSDTTATLGGTGLAKACSGASNCTSITYEGVGAAGRASVMVIPIDTDFSNGETLTIDNLTLAPGTKANAAAAVLGLRLDGAADVANNATDDKTVTIKGTLVLANSNGGVELSKLDDSLDPNAQTVSNAELFSFRLTPAGEGVRATPITVSLSNITAVNCGDFSSLNLYEDQNSSGAVDATEVATGTVNCSISGNSGTMSITNAFATTSARDFILRAGTFSNNNPGNTIRFSINPANITAVGTSTAATITASGSVTEVNQFRSNIAGGQGGGAGGTAAPTPAETPTGGGTPGGGSGSPSPTPPPETPTGGGGPGGGEGTKAPMKYFFAAAMWGMEKLLAMVWQ